MKLWYQPSVTVIEACNGTCRAGVLKLIKWGPAQYSAIKKKVY